MPVLDGLRARRDGNGIHPSNTLTSEIAHGALILNRRQLLATSYSNVATPMLAWPDGRTPRSLQFDDVYYSAEDGLGEAKHVFLAGNGLPSRFRPEFQIAELGFGTGLNMLAALDCWISSGQRGTLRYAGFEAYPLDANEIRRALLPFNSLASQADAMVESLADGKREFEIGPLKARILLGDARETLPMWTGTADAWFLDGFSPTRNPELWEPKLLAEVAGHTAVGGTFATYTASGNIRRSLANVGFSVIRFPGFGRKRHMSAGTLG